MRLVRGAKHLPASWIALADMPRMPDDEMPDRMPKMLEAINELPGVLRPLTADDVHVRGIRLCNDQPFKDGRRRIKQTALAQIASLMRGAPFMLNHDVYSREALPIGRAFHGWAEQAADGVTWASALFYVQRDLPMMDADGLVAAIDGGTITEASIGMYAESFTCSIDGKSAGECDHMPGKDYGEDGGRCLFEYDGITEVEEFSAVMSGAVEGTRYFLAANAAHPDAADPDEIETAALARVAMAPSLFARLAMDGQAHRAIRAAGLRALTGGFTAAE